MSFEVWCDGSIIEKQETNKIFTSHIINYHGSVNKHGFYIGEYDKNIGSLFCELKSINKAIENLKSYKIKDLIIYSDCEPLVKKIYSKNSSYSKKELEKMSNKIRRFIENNDNVNLIKIPRRKNKKADRLCEKVKINYKNKKYLKKARKESFEISKKGKEKYKVGKHTVDYNENYCSCFKNKKWKYEKRSNHKCEHIFHIDILNGSKILSVNK